MPFGPTSEILTERHALAQAVMEGRQAVQQWPEREAQFLARINILNGALLDRDVPLETEPDPGQAEATAPPVLVPDPPAEGVESPSIDSSPPSAGPNRATRRTAKKAPAKKAAARKRSR